MKKSKKGIFWKIFLTNMKWLQRGKHLNRRLQLRNRKRKSMKSSLIRKSWRTKQAKWLFRSMWIAWNSRNWKSKIRRMKNKKLKWKRSWRNLKNSLWNRTNIKSCNKEWVRIQFSRWHKGRRQRWRRKRITYMKLSKLKEKRNKDCLRHSSCNNLVVLGLGVTHLSG